MNDDLITDNMSLVYHIIHHDYPRYKTDEDVIQSGMLGLVKASKNFDASKGKFSTYARRYIHGEIKKELKKREANKICLSLEQLQEGRDVNW